MPNNIVLPRPDHFPANGSGHGQGGSYYGFNSQIGNAPLPTGIQGSANRAYTRGVQPNELAQNQINTITNQASPLMRNAQMRGVRMANARGMINSTAAGEAAQNAVIESAIPLALADAQAYQTAAGQNLEYLNQRDIANMNDWTNQAGINAGIEQENLRNSGALQRQRENLAYSGEQEELGRRYGFDMEGLRNQFGMERDYRNYGMDLGRNEQGYQHDLGRLGAQYGYEQMGLDQNMRRDVYADQYTRTQDFFGNLMDNMIQDPDVFDPQTITSLFSYYNRMMQVGNPALDDILGIGG